MLRRRRFIAAAAFALALLAILGLTGSWWLRALGEALVSSSAPSRADAILVLAGDPRGNRIIHACGLARSGLAPVVLVSGPMETYGINEADLAIRYAVSKGCPAGLMQPVYIRALSTTEEARAIGPELGRRGIRNLVIVTSNYHTARAGRTFRRVLGDSVHVATVAAPDPWFTVDGWWQTREGQKTWFFEASKTVADWIGL